MFGTFLHLAGFALRAAWRGDAEALTLARRLTWELDGRLRSYAAVGGLALPQVGLDGLVPDEVLPLHPGELRSADGGVEPYESLCLAALVRHVRPGCIFEFGTFRGQTTLLLARHGRPDARVYTLDLPPADGQRLAASPAEGDRRYIFKPRIGECFAAAPERGRITQLLGDSLAFDFAPYFGRCELVFVDAAHSYAFVRSDTASAFRMLAPGGVIVWHDYKPGCPGVVRALHEAARSHALVQIAGTSLVVHGLPRGARTRADVPAHARDSTSLVAP